MNNLSLGASSNKIRPFRKESRMRKALCKTKAAHALENQAFLQVSELDVGAFAGKTETGLKVCASTLMQRSGLGSPKLERTFDSEIRQPSPEVADTLVSDDMEMGDKVRWEPELWSLMPKHYVSL